MRACCNRIGATGGTYSTWRATRPLQGPAAITTVVVSHRPGVMKCMDKMLVLQGGKVRAFGPRDEILRSVTARSQTRQVAG